MRMAGIDYLLLSILRNSTPCTRKNAASRYDLDGFIGESTEIELLTGIGTMYLNRRFKALGPART